MIKTLPPEASDFYAFESELAPGNMEPIHTHTRNYSAYFNRSGRGTAHLSNGTTKDVTMLAGSIMHFPVVPVTHFLEAPHLEAPEGASYVAVEYSLPPGVAAPSN